MKPFPEEVSKCILLINSLLPTSCQACRLIRAPSPVLGSSPDTGTGSHSPGLGTYGSRMCQRGSPACWGVWAAGNEHSRALSSLLPSLPVNKRAWSANQRHFLAAELGQLQSEVEIRTAGSTGEENKHQMYHQHTHLSAQPWPQPGGNRLSNILMQRPLDNHSFPC